ncbi:MAG: GNAT family N-acetyltransferase [Thainema sp.]
MKIQAPQKLENQHNTEAFNSGVESLDRWLKERALANENKYNSRTYVVCVDNTVIGYYALAAGSIQRALLPKQQQRNSPDPIPVMVLGRLAVDKDWSGKGIGRGMVRNAILKTFEASRIAGIRALLVHAISEDLVDFYTQFGFVPSPLAPLTLMLTMSDIEETIGTG